MAVNVAIIPARGGSKRIPRKNIRMFHGKPIIAYSIAAAQGVFDRVYVSTEDIDIASIAHFYGAKLLDRPAEHDDVGTQEVTSFAISQIENVAGASVDIACCIYPCAPMLRSSILELSLQTVKRLAVPVYVDGWFYTGRPRWFDYQPLTAGQRWDLKPQAIDINTEDDWKQAERMYAALHA